jgi:hypothetical protein
MPLYALIYPDAINIADKGDDVIVRMDDSRERVRKEKQSPMWVIEIGVFHLWRETRFLDVARAKYALLRELLHGLGWLLSKNLVSEYCF